MVYSYQRHMPFIFSPRVSNKRYPLQTTSLFQKHQRPPCCTVVALCRKQHYSFVGRSYTNNSSARARSITTSSNSLARKQVLIPLLVLLSSVSIGLYQTRTTSNMSNKLIPSNPAEVMVIRNITPNVVTCSVPFARFGTVAVGGRGTIVRLTSGTLAVISPVAFTPEVKAKLTELGGNIAYIIAPDFEHHIFITEWAKEYPSAKIIAPEGLPEKRAKMVGKDDKIGDEKFAFVYDATNKHDNSIDKDFAENFEVEYMESHPNKEIVLFYKPDKILIQADLMFNLPAVEQYSKVPEAAKPSGFANKIFTNLQSTQGEAKGMKRFMWYAMSSKNRPSFNASVQRIDGWDFSTIIPCHGETIEGNGKEVFKKVFDWHLQGHK